MKNLKEGIVEKIGLNVTERLPSNHTVTFTCSSIQGSPQSTDLQTSKTNQLVPFLTLL